MARILIIGDSNWHGSWTESTFKAFQKYGEVEYFSYLNNAPTLKNKIRDRIIKNNFWNGLYKQYYSSKIRLGSFIQNKKFDYTIILRGEILEESDILILKKHTGKLITWWVDDIFVFPNFAKLLPHFDHVFIFDSFYFPQLKENGAKQVHWLPCAYNDTIYKPGQIDKEYECDVAFIGSYFPPREKLFDKFLDKKIHFKIWGPNWRKSGLEKFFKNYPNAFQGNQISNVNAAKLYQSAKILLNLNHPQTKHDGMNQRAFEITACNGFQLMDYREGFSRIFQNNEDVVYFKSSDQIPDLVNFYLNNPEKRLQISISGFNKTVNVHSIDNRVKQILEIIEQ